VSFVASAFICAWSYLIYDILFEAEYLEGFIIAPYLFLAPLLQMLFQVACNQFIVIKKTWPNMLILSGGALVNVALNFVLIPILGIEGAAIATLIGYVVSDVVCVMVLYKMKLIVLSGRFYGSVLAMLAFFVIWRAFFASATLISTLLAFAFTAVILLLYRKECTELVKKIVKR
jgi:O-antigen/teichoic acid export membrane protein